MPLPEHECLQLAPPACLEELLQTALPLLDERKVLHLDQQLMFTCLSGIQKFVLSFFENGLESPQNFAFEVPLDKLGALLF